MDIVLQACREMEIDADALAALPPGAQPREAVQALLDAGRPQEGLQLLARLLPRRYAVAWLCQCAAGEALSEDDRAGAALAEQWLRDPGEGNRRLAYEFANADGYATLGGWLAANAGWSAGSLAPEGQESAVPPPPALGARATVAAANLLAALDGGQFEARRAAFTARALPLLGEGGDAAKRGG